MINLTELDDYRLLGHKFGGGNDKCGAFEIPYKYAQGVILLRVIASSGHGWDHVSVSLVDRCPWWHEMEYIKRMFFKPDECVMQLHPPIADYVDGSYHQNCPTCLHMWRPHSRAIPRPPKYMVGGMSEEEASEAMRKDGF